MLDSRSFLLYRNLVISEVFGAGKYVYEYLIEGYNNVVIKVMINANSLKECEDYFKRRFTLRSVSHQSKTSQYFGNFYTYDEVLDMTSRQAFQSVICRRVY